ncbi:MAG: tetratricopeptide repeat protein, partial [Acidobacteriales bacterium]|nr:tetratricopeptide repeat protein [Terriglobales bacterium]
MDQAKSLYLAGKSEQAKKVFESVLPELSKFPASASLGDAQNGLAQIYTDQGAYDLAKRAASSAVEVFRRINDPPKEGEAWNNKALAEIQSGDYQAAQQDLQRALELAHSDPHSSLAVKVLNNLGSAQFFLGKYSEALADYNQALMMVNANSQSSWVVYWRQITQFNQATLYQKLGKYESALQIYLAVRAHSKTLTAGDRAHLLANLGSLYRRLGDPYKALDQYRAAQALYLQRHDSDGEIGVLKNVGIVYGLDLQDLVHAEKLFREGLALAEKTRNRREAMQSQLYLGEVLLRQGREQAAAAAFQSALDAARELQTSEEQWKALYGLGRIEELRN